MNSSRSLAECGQKINKICDHHPKTATKGALYRAASCGKGSKATIPAGFREDDELKEGVVHQKADLRGRERRAGGRWPEIPPSAWIRGGIGLNNEKNIIFVD
ncbi:MAG: hypothetical protein K5984_05405 [Bacteroidales bacterium]|nr:hypothetical protein [Bacteroidales bacterium]